MTDPRKLIESAKDAHDIELVDLAPKLARALERALDDVELRKQSYDNLDDVNIRLNEENARLKAALELAKKQREYWFRKWCTDLDKNHEYNVTYVNDIDELD